MKITQIRNATNTLYYGNTTFLIDPWLAPKHTLYTAAMEPQLYHLVDPSWIAWPCHFTIFP